ncbi:MAG TPA: taurine dioxygenase [Rhodospirillaceae bacterium]|nr:taurine dioxygenase [Rhodospirillaceae bacterium]HAA92956.1 taurine dioxygenase [Rhodospirillaceae bacterium]HAT34138.1 taurine dioxygenase [Rhodospirillaceae bacterium]
MALELVTCDRPLGAEIKGLDTTVPLSSDDVAFVSDALLRHSVIFLRNNELSDTGFRDFSANFGTLRESNLKFALVSGLRELNTLSNVIENGRHIGNMDAGVYWHSDGAYTPKPTHFTILYGLEIPAKNGKSLGSTRFSSTAAAYEALPDQMKKRLEGMKVVNSMAHQVEKKRAAGVLKRGELNEHQIRNGIETVHPLVRTHHLSGRKSLFLSEGHTIKILDPDGASDEDLLAELQDHIVQPQFIYAHDWQVGDILMWDNITTNHKASFDYDLPLRRVIRRSTVQGPVPA